MKTHFSLFVLFLFVSSHVFAQGGTFDCNGSVASTFSDCLITGASDCASSSSAICAETDGVRMLALELSEEAAVSCCSVDASCFKFRQRHYKKVRRLLKAVYGSDFSDRTSALITQYQDEFARDGECAL